MAIGFALLGLFGGIQKAKAEREAGEQRRRSAYLNAIEVGYQKKQAEIQAIQQHNFRLQEYAIAKASNINFDSFRNVEGASVDAYLKRNESTAYGDITRLASDRKLQSLQLTRQQKRLREEGDYALRAAKTTAFSTMINTGMNFGKTYMG
tara:strand:- start:649 stop:1098 length:450 start_codon:yes stop_codon:yes gene_type:complete